MVTDGDHQLASGAMSWEGALVSVWLLETGVLGTFIRCSVCVCVCVCAYVCVRARARVYACVPCARACLCLCLCLCLGLPLYLYVSLCLSLGTPQIRVALVTLVPLPD